MRPTLLSIVLALSSCGGRQVSLVSDGNGGPLVDGGSLGTTGCASSEDCAPGEICHRDAGCPSAAARGACRPRPLGCSRDCPGVCGCDGKTYCNACNAESVGVNVKSEGACGSCEATCHVHNSCCRCEATTKLDPEIDCAMVCDAPRCESVGIGKPIAYCLNQRCLLASTQQGCSSDGDCLMVDDCCFCLAHPKNAPNPAATCAADCEAGLCTGLGLGNAIPRCIQGVCKLTL